MKSNAAKKPATPAAAPKKSAAARTVSMFDAPAMAEQTNRAPTMVELSDERVRKVAIVRGQMGTVTYAPAYHYVLVGDTHSLCGLELPEKPFVEESLRHCQACRAEASKRRLVVR